MLGSETRGLDDLNKSALQNPEYQRVFLPMLPEIRAYNLANAAAMCAFEALRQRRFDGVE